MVTESRLAFSCNSSATHETQVLLFSHARPVGLVSQQAKVTGVVPAQTGHTMQSHTTHVCMRARK